MYFDGAICFVEQESCCHSDGVGSQSCPRFVVKFVKQTQRLFYAEEKRETTFVPFKSNYSVFLIILS